MSKPGIFEKISVRNDPSLFFFCDHASNRIPAEYDSLGLEPHHLEEHIAYDVGAADMTRRLAELSGGAAVLCEFSRLLVDVNRDLDRADSMPEVSDQIIIPGNQRLSMDERNRRVEHFFEPYHQGLGAVLEEIAEECEDGPFFAVSVHSYTVKLRTDAPRNCHLAVLWDHDEESARQFLAAARQKTDYSVADNEPYSAKAFNYTINRHIAPRGIHHLTLEVRQDLIDETESAHRMADLLYELIKPVAEDRVAEREV